MKIFVFLSLIAVAGLAIADQEFQPGQSINTVQELADSAQSYALYLPSAYTPSRKWPILYCFDARAQGVEPLELFRPAAEKYGFILACSNNSMSDDPTVPNLQIVKAIWEDTHKRLSIDETRTYATGFSGNARVSCDMGTQYHLAGVIGCGAGFPPDRPPSSDLPYVYFGTIGERDMNFYEMRILGEKFQSLGIPYRIRSFDGTHEWPPEAVCTEAIEWMEIQAMRRNLRGKDPALIQSLFNKRMDAAKLSETSGKQYEAAIRYGEIAEDFEGLIDATPASSKTRELMATDTYRAEADVWNRREKEFNDFGTKLASVARSLRSSEHVPELQTVKAFLDIDNLEKKAAIKSDLQESLHAQRLLSTASAQCSFYLPRTYFERGEYAKAALVLSLSVDINPQEPWNWYALAHAYAQMGEKKKGLDALSHAVQAGFDNPEKMERDFDLKPLREEKEFQKLVERARKQKKSQ